MAQYEYDAWGKHISITDGSGNDVSNNETHIANINPFRYRGYYFDVETGWYYLNARYYDPNVGRFISPDAILGANGGLQGYNLFAYCNNNPVMYIDPNGQALVATFAIGGLVAIAAFGLYEGAMLIFELAKDVVDVVEEWTDTDNNENSNNIMETPIQTIEDIRNNIQIYQERTFYISTIFPRPKIIFEVDGNIVTFDPNALEFPSITIRKSGNTGLKGRANEKKQGRERKEKKKNKRNWNPNPNKKPMIQPGRHTPGRDHRKY